MFSKIKNIIKKIILENIIYLIIELVVFFIILLAKLGLLEIVFGGIIIELFLNQFLSYFINQKKVLLSHIYRKQEKEFNKEYYDLYWDTNLIRIKTLVFVEYVSLLVYTKVFNNSKDLIMDSFVKGFICLFFGFIIWVFLMIWVLNYKDNKKIDKLINKKKDSFDLYTDGEKEILELCD